jgi:hypothetical protein
MKKTSHRPYLSHPARLGDVIAAITAMGSYAFAKRPIQHWAESLGPPASISDEAPDSWRRILSEHPEFFLIEGDSATLRWRRAKDRVYHRIQKRELTGDEVKALPEPEKEELTREPLTTDQITALIETAVGLHEREIAQKAESRWYVSGVLTFLGTLLGAIIGLVGTIIGAGLKSK